MNENQEPMLDPIQNQATGQAEPPATEPAPFGGQYKAPAAAEDDSPAYGGTGAYRQSAGNGGNSPYGGNSAFRQSDEDEGYSFSYGGSSTYRNPANPYVIHAEPPKKKHTGLIIGLGCLLLALLAAGGWWLLSNRSTDPLKSLKNAANKTLDSYLDFFKDLPNMHQCLENEKSFVESDSKHINLNVALDGITQVPDMNIQVGVDLDGKAKATLVHGSFVNGEMTVPVDIYIDKDQIQIGSSTLLNEGEAFAIPIQNLGQKWNSSPLAESTKLPDDLSLSFLTEGLSEQSMIDTFGEDWTTFKESVTYRKATEADGADYFTGKGETYVLVWDQALLDKLGQRAKGIVDSWTSTSKLEHVYPTFAMGFLSAVGQKIEAPRLLVENDMLVGVSIQEKTTQTEKTVAVMELLGETNPWSRYQLTFSKLNSSTQKLETVQSLEYTMTIADGKLQAKGVQKGADGKETASMEFVYADADGSNAFKVDGDFAVGGSGYSPMPGSNVSDMMQSLLDSMSIRMTPTDGGVKMEESIDLSTFPSTSMFSLTGKATISLELSTKIEAVKPLSDKPTQLLEMDQMSLGMLAMRVMQKLGLTQGFGQ